MFTYEQIKELVELVSRHRLHNFEMERAGFRLHIACEQQGVVRETVSGAGPPAAAAGAAAAGGGASASPPTGPKSATTPAAMAPTTALHVVASPIVGTFYASSSPDAPLYVKVGDRVVKGQVLCIVEAMKLMNEIEADADGVVAEIYPKNAQPVEYGEPLFGLRVD